MTGPQDINTHVRRAESQLRELSKQVVRKRRFFGRRFARKFFSMRFFGRKFFGKEYPRQQEFMTRWLMIIL